MLGKGIARAFGGALLFSLPLLMTMEMWSLGSTASRWRLGLLVVATVLLAVVLAKYYGFLNQRQTSVGDAVVDAGVAALVGCVAAGAVLTVLAVIHPLRDTADAVSVLAIEMLPATIGASFARSQLGEDSRPERRRPGPGQELTIVVAGAAVFSASIAPTEEVLLLAASMTDSHALALIGVSLALTHGFVYGAGFKGGTRASGGFWRSFTAHTVPGYAAALAVGAYLLWSFGRLDGLALQPAVTRILVIGLPASIGAAAARLIL